MRRTRPQVTVGWREWVSLPDLDLPTMKAKMDTGALSSALHAFAVHTEELADGTEVAHFRVHPYQRNNEISLACSAPVVDTRWIRSSTGHRQRRLVIMTQLRIGDKTMHTEVTLSNRSLMGFRLLIGRRALRKGFLVDSARSYVVTARPGGNK